jgi:hypothetical protein
VPAADIEALIIRSVREHLKPSEEIDDRNLSVSALSSPPRQAANVPRRAEAVRQAILGG